MDDSSLFLQRSGISIIIEEAYMAIGVICTFLEEELLYESVCLYVSLSVTLFLKTLKILLPINFTDILIKYKIF